VIDNPETSGGAGTSRDKATKTTRKSGSVDDEQDDASAEATTTIEEKLEKLRTERDEARQTSGDAEGDFTDTESRLSILEGVERDYPNTKKAYDAAYPQLLRESNNVTDYLDSEKSKLRTRLGDKTAKRVDDRVTAFHDKTEALKVAVTKAQQPRDSVPIEVHQKAVKDCTGELNAWKNLTATVTAQLGELKKLRDDITKARQEGHYGLAYGLVLMAKKKQEIHKKGPGLVKPTDLHKKFHLAGEKLAKAQKDLATAERDLESDKATLAAAVKALEDHQKSAEAKLRVDLVDFTPDANGEAAGDKAPDGGKAGSSNRASSASGAAKVPAAATGPDAAGEVATAAAESSATTDKTGES
jgi:hypothetical protein